MNALIDAAFSRSRVVVMLLVMILTLGTIAYIAVPKEATPEIAVPIVYATATLDGISPDDAEQLLVKPMEREFASLNNLDGMESHAAEGYASVQLEFTPGGDVDAALDKVREAKERVQGELPADASDITIAELNTALFPIITVLLSGNVPERTLNELADDAKEAIESLSDVLEVDIGGKRDEFLEVLIDPTIFQTYNLSFEQVIGQIQRNNLLIAAGAIESEGGRIALKVPGLIEDFNDVLNMPIKVRDGTVVTFSDVATIRRTFEAPSGFARINGQPALSLEVKKRSGANIINTVAEVTAVVEELKADWPETIKVDFLQDQSEMVKTFLSDLEANVMAAVILVMIVILFALGPRSAFLVGLAIPGAFLSGVTILWALGYTMNIVVLFSLILVVGMLVDGAIVTVELAERRLQQGGAPKAAYAYAAKRMAWPIIASTATTLSVFFPLLFWTGNVGEFMKFMPITVILTLFSSLFMALIFIPVVGGLIGRKQPQSARAKKALYDAEEGDPRDIGGITGVYVRVLEAAILRPGATVLFAVAMLLGAFGLYGQFGNGLTFFPSQEPEFMQVQIRARDNTSIYERDRLVRLVENRLLGYDEVASLYARSVLGTGRGDDETIGTLQLELIDWDKRRKAVDIAEQIRGDVADIAGIDVQVLTDSGGPSAGKPISLQLLAQNGDAQRTAVEAVRGAMAAIGGFTDITDTRSLPGVELSINVDRVEAARFGADVSLLGQAVRLLTQGIKVADYRPDDVDGSLDIRVRFPNEDRSLADLANLNIPTSSGLVPIANFVSYTPTDRVGTITRIDERRVVTIEANLAPGYALTDQVAQLIAFMEGGGLPDGVTYTFAGEAEDQNEAMAFLLGAFIASIFLMFVILLMQFNSFYQAFVVMSAIVFSIAGVLLGLIVTGRPFGVVMGGVAVIALAGIVVNNNIVLIDAYNQFRSAGQSPLEAALRAGSQRLRPVILTSITTALGLMPMVLGLNINFFSRVIIYGAPSSQMWTELSSAIAGGLVIATMLTLIVTPAMLMLGEKKKTRSVSGVPSQA